MNEEHEVKHKRWGSPVEGLFTAISYVFGIGNVLIFPYYCGIHGGGKSCNFVFLCNKIKIISMDSISSSDTII